MYENAERSKKKIKLTAYYEDGTGFSEDEIHKFIKKEIRKELQKTLPYEIKTQNNTKTNSSKIFFLIVVHDFYDYAFLKVKPSPFILVLLLTFGCLNNAHRTQKILEKKNQ